MSMLLMFLTKDTIELISAFLRVSIAIYRSLKKGKRTALVLSFSTDLLTPFLLCPTRVRHDV